MKRILREVQNGTLKYSEINEQEWKNIDAKEIKKAIKKFKKMEILGKR